MPIQQIFLGVGGAEAETYWITIVGDDSPYMQIRDKDTVAVYTDGSVYSGCNMDDGSDGDRKSYLVKLDKTGAVSWQRTVANDARSWGAGGLQVDSAGDVYQCGQKSASDGDGQFVHKFNSSGAIQWQRRLYGNKEEWPTDIVVDSSDNVYVFGPQEINGESSKQQSLMAKYSSSGTLIWQKRLYWSISSKEYKSHFQAAIDSNDNIYTQGSLYESGAQPKGGLFKIDDDGDDVWVRTQVTTSTDTRGLGVAVDSSDNVITCAYCGDTGTNTIVKYDSSGDLVWQKYIESGSSDTFTSLDGIQSLAVDTNDSIYGIGSCSGSGTGDWIFLAKWNSSGTLQWQRRIQKERNDDWASATDYDTVGSSIRTLGNHSVYFAMRVGSLTANEESLAVCKLPADGTLTGSHGDFDITATTFTYGTDTTLVTNGSESLGTTTSSISTNTPSYTVATVSFTSLKTDVD